MSYNTGNAVPSSDPRDLDDNALAFDRFLQSTAATEADRLGKLRKTWSQMERDAAALVSPNVAALAAVAPAVDRAFYFSAVSPVGIGVYTVTAFSRTLAAAVDASAHRTAIGLGSVATESVVPIAKGGTGQIGAPAARDALGVLNVTQTYIDGLQLVWQANSIFVGIGAAFIPGPLKVAETLSGVSVPLTGLTANTFYHLYLYLNAGVAAVELSATAPAAYGSTAFIKTGDTSRRYLGSILASGATTAYRFIHDGNRVLYNVGSIASAPFALLNGTAIVDTVVNSSPAVPITATAVSVMISNGASASTVRLGNADMGTTSSANHRQYVLSGQAQQLDILLTSVQQFSYIFDSTPSGSLTIRANGYIFKR